MVEQGTHAQLLSHHGRYQALWQAQMAARVWRDDGVSASGGSQERRSRMLILRGQVALAAILTIAAAIGWFGREGGFPDTQIVALFVLFMVRAGRRQLSGNDVRRRGVPDAVGGIRLACRHADDGGADYGAVTPAVAHYGA